MDNTLVIVVLGAAIIILIFFRTRRSGPKHTTITRRHWEDFKRQQEDEGPPSEPQWTIKEIGEGGELHMSLPKGLEEDYSVRRRDRIEREDEQIEYNLQLSGPDPDHTVWINWWTAGFSTHAWLVEGLDGTLDTLGLNQGILDEMASAGEGTVTYRDREYYLEHSGTMLSYVGGKRPGKEFQRWDFRDEKDSRQILIQLRPWEELGHEIYQGHELWLRDLTIISPRSEATPE